MGWVLDKHSVKSTYVRDNSFGRPQFDTTRTEAGEATYQLKYRSQWDRVPILAHALAEHIWPKFEAVGFVVPMPPSTDRNRQPVNEVAQELGRLKAVPVFEGLLLRTATDKPLKDMKLKDEKIAALHGRFRIEDEISNDGRWNVLLLDDLFDTGASMETAATALKTYGKVRRIYVAALTWK